MSYSDFDVLLWSDHLNDGFADPIAFREYEDNLVLSLIEFTITFSIKHDLHASD